MSQTGIVKSFQMPDGTEISIETGRLAKQTDGSVVVRMGNTMLLATIVSAKDVDDDLDFLPLTVEYKEKYASTGRFPGGFFKREARPTENEILTARLIDRALRPLFPDDYHASTVVSVFLISSDRTMLPDCLAAFAASAAIAVSDIPFSGPISEVRVGRMDGKYVINPSIEDMAKCDIDMIVAGSMDSVVMVEGEMKEISEEEMLGAIKHAHEAIKVQVQAQMDLQKQVNPTIREYEHERKDEALQKAIHDACYDKCVEVAAAKINDKAKRKEEFSAIKKAFVESISEEEASEKSFLISQYFHKTEKEAVRNVMLDKRYRLDGRQMNEIRDIWTEIDYLPMAHGSALFTRGETQSLTTVTLGTKLDEQTIDGAVIEGKEKFLLHYNFPPLSVGEARPPRSTSRREIGHGNLALRALKPVIPADYPYTIRVVSDILESNGSSSMATVCAGSLSLMDAGVPIKDGVSGIAMGLITDASGKYAILSDILGDEDHLGDMDFKVAGTDAGITACQMDIKIEGLSYDMLNEALQQAKEGRAHILNEMKKTITKANDDYKDHVPRVEVIEIDKEFIGAVIGPGGKIIQELQERTESTITITEEGNKGRVEIFSTNKANITAALQSIKNIVSVPEIGDTYDATVKSVMPYGAFVEFMPGKQGLLHISEISWSRLENMDGVMSEGDPVKVKLVDIDKQGRYKLSRKVLLPKPEKASNN